MNNERTETDKQLHALADEVTKGYAQLFAEAADGTFNTTDQKARKRALALKEKEMKRLFADAKKAARHKGNPAA